MSFFDALRIAVRAIVANRLRSLLTLLGLVIGVSSVIALIAVGQGTQKGVSDQIRGLGTDLIFIEPSAAATTQQGAGALLTTTLTQADALAISANGNPGIQAVSAHITAHAGNRRSEQCRRRIGLHIVQLRRGTRPGDCPGLLHCSTT